VEELFLPRYTGGRSGSDNNREKVAGIEVMKYIVSMYSLFRDGIYIFAEAESCRKSDEESKGESRENV
jgi:hypothetical protein